MGRRILLVVMLIVAALASQTTPVFAERVIEAYFGPSFTDNARVTAASYPLYNQAGRDVHFGTDVAYGMRGGFWFDKLPWLFIGGDLASRHATGDHASFDITPLSFLVMFRLPLEVSDALPQGRFQPYIGIGPSVSFYTFAATDIESGVNKNWSFSAGFLLPAGLKLQLSKHLALFGEYRFTYSDIDIQNNLLSMSNPNHVRAILTGHDLLFGTAYHF